MNGASGRQILVQCSFFDHAAFCILDAVHHHKSGGIDLFYVSIQPGLFKPGDHCVNYINITLLLTCLSKTASTFVNCNSSAQIFGDHQSDLLVMCRNNGYTGVLL